MKLTLLEDPAENEAAWRRLTSAFGGQHIVIPKSFHGDRRLCDVLGIVAAHRVIVRHGGRRLYVSSRSASLRAKRNRAIRREVASGDSMAAVARRHGLTPKTVSRIIAGT